MINFIHYKTRGVGAPLYTDAHFTRPGFYCTTPVANSINLLAYCSGFTVENSAFYTRQTRHELPGDTVTARDLGLTPCFAALAAWAAFFFRLYTCKQRVSTGSGHGTPKARTGNTHRQRVNNANTEVVGLLGTQGLNGIRIPTPVDVRLYL